MNHFNAVNSSETRNVLNFTEMIFRTNYIVILVIITIYGTQKIFFIYGLDNTLLDIA